MKQILNQLKVHSLHQGHQTAVLADRVYTYKQLWDDVEHMSQWLQAQPSKRIALMAPNGYAWLVCDLACVKAHKHLMPIPLFFSPSQIQHMLEQAQIDLILSAPDYTSQLKTPACIQASQTPIGYDALLYAQGPLDSFWQQPSMKITFTSGSTGTPKGVCLSHSMLEHIVLSMVQMPTFKSIERHLCLLPFSILLENIFGIYAVLFLGKTIIIPDESPWPLSKLAPVCSQFFERSFKKFDPHSMIVMPAQLMSLVQTFRQTPLAHHLTYVAVGGAHVNPQLLKNAHQMGLPVYEGYGLSECGSVISLNTPENHKQGSTGKILPHIDYRIAKDNELIVTSPTMIGYLHDHAKAKEVHTGDIVQVDSQGYLRLMGRKKHIIINAYGRNICPEWIETQLVTHPDILQAAVFGEGQTALSAVIVAHSHISKEKLKKAIEEVNAQLPRYAHIKDWVQSKTPFSLDNHMLGYDLMPNRTNIFHHFQDQINFIQTKQVRAL